MAIVKLSVIVPLVLFLLHSAAAAPISGDLEQKRGYDGDWLYSRQSRKASPPPLPPFPHEGNLVAATATRDGSLIEI